MFNKGLAGVLISSTLLSGCAMPMDDMMNNNFNNIISDSVPEQMVGTWTGTMGPYVTTFKFEEDGSGLYCYDWNTTKAIHRIKYANGKIEHQDGKHMNVTEASESRIVTDWPYVGANDVTLYPDEGLTKASIYCSKHIDG